MKIICEHMQNNAQKWFTHILLSDGKASEGKWPDQGDVVFRNVSLKYNEDESPVLKNLNFCIEAREKVMMLCAENLWSFV